MNEAITWRQLALLGYAALIVYLAFKPMPEAEE